MWLANVTIIGHESSVTPLGFGAFPRAEICVDYLGIAFYGIRKSQSNFTKWLTDVQAHDIHETKINIKSVFSQNGICSIEINRTKWFNTRLFTYAPIHTTFDTTYNISTIMTP